MAAFNTDNNHFNAPIPGQSLTQKPGNAAWEHPPRFAKLTDACDYVFNALMNAPKLHQLMTFMKSGISLEALAKVIIFSGFSQGLWTPDLGMLMAKPVMYMLAGIANRAGIKAKVSHVDRSGMKDLVGFKKVTNDIMSSQNMQNMEPLKSPTGVPPAVKGLMAPES